MSPLGLCCVRSPSCVRSSLGLWPLLDTLSLAPPGRFVSGLWPLLDALPLASFWLWPLCLRSPSRVSVCGPLPSLARSASSASACRCLRSSLSPLSGPLCARPVFALRLRSSSPLRLRFPFFSAAAVAVPRYRTWYWKWNVETGLSDWLLGFFFFFNNWCIYRVSCVFGFVCFGSCVLSCVLGLGGPRLVRRG